jgi:Clostripain family
LYFRGAFFLTSTDNNLEFFLREDLGEYLNSPAIQDPTIISWIYFDGRDLNGTIQDITDPLPNIFFDNGTTIPQKFEGSVYLNYNHTRSRLIIDTVLPGEQNSDLPETVVTFLTKAFTDCVSKSATEFLLLFSSHGAGFAGFGGDENTQRRRLIQSNQFLTTAISESLQAVDGAPSKVNVLAFDACLMSDLGAFDEYRAVADYILASEAVVPGHGRCLNSLFIFI